MSYGRNESVLYCYKQIKYRIQCFRSLQDIADTDADADADADALATSSRATHRVAKVGFLHAASPNVVLIFTSHFIANLLYF